MWPWVSNKNAHKVELPNFCFNNKKVLLATQREGWSHAGYKIVGWITGDECGLFLNMNLFCCSISLLLSLPVSHPVLFISRFPSYFQSGLALLALIAASGTGRIRTRVSWDRPVLCVLDMIVCTFTPTSTLTSSYWLFSFSYRQVPFQWQCQQVHLHCHPFSASMSVPRCLFRRGSLSSSFAGGLGEQTFVPSQNNTSTNRSSKTVKKGNVVPHPDLWVSFIYFFIHCEIMFCHVYLCVHMHLWSTDLIPGAWACWWSVTRGQGWSCVFKWDDIVEQYQNPLEQKMSKVVL